MGVVRREGDWRLEKRTEGVYEITYDGRVRQKIVTDDYSPTGYTDERDDMSTPVREVHSFSEAERMFESSVKGPDPVGDGDLAEVPPIIWAITFGLFGAIFGWSAFPDYDSIIFVISAVFLLVPLGVAGMTYYKYRQGGLKTAGLFLVKEPGTVPTPSNAGTESTDDNSGTVSGNPSTDGSGPSVEKTPPTPQSMKDTIYFDRADQRCEWCNERTDSPEIHHIEPRSEGGPNAYNNLIALCPVCHRKADKGGISTSKLSSKLSRQMDGWSPPS